LSSQLFEKKPKVSFSKPPFLTSGQGGVKQGGALYTLKYGTCLNT